MIEIYQNLFIGSQDDYERRVRREQGWRVVHACKEPYHRAALGYTGRAVHKAHPEYLIACRGHRLILNLIDADDPAYIPKQIVDAAVAFIHKGLQDGQRVLVHCNQGESRAPAIGLLYLVAYTDAIPSASPDDAVLAFRQIYPCYNPAAGMEGFVRRHLPAYRAQKGETAPSPAVAVAAPPIDGASAGEDRPGEPPIKNGMSIGPHDSARLKQYPDS